MYIDIGSRREVMWDESVIDAEHTTAQLLLHKPQKKELALSFDKPWEGDGVGYPVCIKIDEKYRMYYVCGMITKDGEADRRAVCVFESSDLKNWVRPSLGIQEFMGNKDNNIILWQDKQPDFDEAFDNFFVFVDENPDCPPDERIKATALCYNHTKPGRGERELWCYTSSDGLHFKRSWKMASGDEPNGGIFDSLNTVMYDTESHKYMAFVRGIHSRYPKDTDIRDVRYMESVDFKKWSEPVLLDFGASDDIQLYTNNVQRYERAPHMLIGFPTRYVDRVDWVKNFDLLGGEENVRRRRARMRDNTRFGTVITDCVFMTSRDGIRWNRFDEMFIGPGLEHDGNWVYGDSSYPMYNVYETPCEHPVKGTELSMWVMEGHWSGVASWLYRYSIRLDGFASYHAGDKEYVLITKPVIFEGEELSINFATSAPGYIYVDILNESGKPVEGFRSCEIFGNSLDRTVYFDSSSDVSKMAGHPVRLRFTMREADLYSFVFRPKNK